MKKAAWLLVVLLLIPFVAFAENDDQAVNWPNGRIWGDLQFYHSCESIRADGYIITEQSFLGQDGILQYNGHAYNVGIRVSDYGGSPKSSIDIKGQESTPDDALLQFDSIISELFEKWGAPIAESCQKPWDSGLDSNPDVLAKSGVPFTYGIVWNHGDSSARANIGSQINGVCSISIYFFE